jgi:DNA-binding NarL/FixJ family response regulator
MTRVRVLVADDHDIVRRGLRAVLEAEEGWTVCYEAKNGREAVAKTRELAPDVAVIDVTMPELNGLEACRQIVKTAPHTEVLILTMHESEEVVREVLAAGASGYVLKSDAGHHLVAAIAALLRGEPFFSSRVAALVVQGYGGRTARGSSDYTRRPLTPRERQIVQLLAEGRTNKEVAAALGISIKTVEAHRANIMRKLGTHSIGEVVRYAIRNRIVEA